MKYLITISIIIFGVSCKNQSQNKIEVAFNQSLANELEKRAKLDQTAANLPPGKYNEYSNEDWEEYKDSVFTTNKVFLEDVLNEYGYPGYDFVGKEGANNYWLMVQHCDFDPKFQGRVLEKLKGQVEIDNAGGREFGLLTDRVNLNTGKKQIYGTQVTYVKKTGQAIPRALQDSLGVNERRESVGLEPIEKYLNRMSINHFNMNKENMLKRGVTEPKLYKLQNKTSR